MSWKAIYCYFKGKFSHQLACKLRHTCSRTVLIFKKLHAVLNCLSCLHVHPQVSDKGGYLYMNGKRKVRVFQGYKNHVDSDIRSLTTIKKPTDSAKRKKLYKWMLSSIPIGIFLLISVWGIIVF